MEKENEIKRIKNINESGAALATVIFVTVLLTTAIIALLSAAANHSKNVTDVLGETKAYYAAESGLQAAINVLRGNTDTTPTNSADDINYTKATSSALSNYSGDPNPARLSAWLTYDYPTTGTPDRIVIGQAANAYNPKTGTAYSITVEDPDNSSDVMSYKTSGVFKTYSDPSNNTKAGFSVDHKTIYICAVAVTTCDNLEPNRTELSFTDQGVTTVDFRNPITSSSLGSINIVQNAVNFGGTIKFTNDYIITYPRTANRNIHGSITKSGSNFVAGFDSQIYQVIGSEFELCDAANLTAPCSDVTLTWSSGSASYYAYFSEPVEPYRLRVVSTGYGPNGAKKQLEAFVQKDFLNGFSSPAPLMMQGPNASFYGSSAAYNIDGVDNVNGSIPAVGVTDSASLANVQGCNCNPAPAIVTDVPDWMSTPQNLDTFIKQLRNTAINSGRYYSNTSLSNTGNYSTGTGITFCDGNCSVNNNADGGGILVVTGTLSSAVWKFKGLIIITGAGGWDRQGGGNRDVIGNVVIAPYDPNNLNAGFGSPFYKCQGCGSTLIDYDPITLDTAFNGTKAVSNFVLGIAEK